MNLQKEHILLQMAISFDKLRSLLYELHTLESMPFDDYLKLNRELYEFINKIRTYDTCRDL